MNGGRPWSGATGARSRPISAPSTPAASSASHSFFERRPSMAGLYTISAGGITVANQAVTLLFLHVGATQSLEVIRCWVSQSGTATGAMQRVQLVTQVTAFPTLTSA